MTTQPFRASPSAFEALAPDDPGEVGGYRLRARLGAGGMGRVYLAYTPGGRPVALKVVRPELAEDAGFRHRFAQEVASARRIHGLYTAQVVDAGIDAASPWLATTFVPGPSLQQVVRRHGPLPERTVLLLFAGIAEALQAIHAAGVVHRDLKPGNVLVAPGTWLVRPVPSTSRRTATRTSRRPVPSPSSTASRASKRSPPPPCRSPHCAPTAASASAPRAARTSPSSVRSPPPRPTARSDSPSPTTGVRPD